jgi:hypothetical protein
MKTFFIICLGLLSAPLRADPYLIIPGVSIGQTHLGPNGAAFLKKLPKPDASNHGMMQGELVWTSHTEGKVLQTLYIHTTDNGATEALPKDGVTINEIRVTSAVYHTWGGLHTGSTFAAIRRQFPGGREVNGKAGIYDDVSRGIAFEFAFGSPRCIAITVHPKGGTNGVAAADQVNGILKANASGQP